MLLWQDVETSLVSREKATKIWSESGFHMTLSAEYTCAALFHVVMTSALYLIC